MASTQVAKFTCSACGRQYPWKAEIAGRNAKCKCGQALIVPATPDPEPDPDIIDFADLEAAASGKPVAVGPVAEAGADGGGYRCPSCATDLTPGAMLCTACGYNMKTGSHVKTQIGGGPDRPVAAKGAAKAAAAAGPHNWGGRPGQRSNRGASAENAQTIKQVALGAVAVVVVLGLIFGAKMVFKKGQEPTGPMLGDDAKVLAWFRDDEPMEAMAFVDMHDSKTLLMTWTNRQSRNKIQQWYDMGVVKVWTFNSPMPRFAIWELPPDPAKRQALFQWAKIWEEDRGLPAPTDVGQKYIILHLA
jgi:hypothetical protein